MRDRVRLGCWAAFWGDTSTAVDQILDGSQVDYLVSDYLSEITMALLARARAKDPEAGFVPDALRVLSPRLAEIHERGIRIVTNAGALNPAACARAFAEAAEAAGVPLRVAAIEGDDLMGQLEGLHAAGASDMFTAEPLPENPMTMNAYLGARPIADALAAGADVVVTGRSVDSSVVLGPLLHEFGWGDDDYDLLSAGTLAGHIVECGPQCTGGNFTDWDAVPGWENMGFPVVECHSDGTAIVSKPDNTGGLITPATIGEQIVYEIGDPGAYVMPDVVCDWRNVHLQQVGLNQVRASGARGSRPPSTCKVTATHVDGYRVMTNAMFSGLDAAAKARRAGEALATRAERMIVKAGFGPITERSIEVIGAGDTHGPEHRNDTATEAVVKVALRHPEKAALEIFALEYAPMALVAQGMTGFFGGRPRVAPAIGVYHLLVEKSTVDVTVRIGDEVSKVEVSPGDSSLTIGTPELLTGAAGTAVFGQGFSVPLRRLAYARSGDKGNNANIGVIARRPEFAEVIADQVTTSRVRAHFAQYLEGGVRRWEMPGLPAINFVLEGALGGRGGTSTLRYDPQGKSFGAMLLEIPIAVPAEWDRDGLLTGGGKRRVSLPEKVLVANRGEIAVRIMRTLSRMGIAGVAVYHALDAGGPAALTADESVELFGETPVGAYLDIDAIIGAALQTGAEAIHPGFGFLSENPALAEAVTAAGLAWIGPPPAAMRAMGDKLTSKRLAQAAGVPTLPGSDGAVDSAGAAVTAAEGIGYPVLVKASAGGGGKGMRIAGDPDELREAFERASGEALASFGDGRVFVERFIERPRHIEIQVLADAHGTVLHLGERECSIQRRYQKVIEECPSPFVDDQMRLAMAKTAVDLARAVDYRSAGTVEMIADDQGGFYFLEMNTRLQVEHPVTELVTGIDIVAEQIRIAAGEPLAITQDDVRMRGHAIECRVYAEDAEAGFIPATGRLAVVRFPSGAGIRVDSGVLEGGEISSAFDPMIAKVCAHAPTRAEAIRCEREALRQTVLLGATTNTAFLERVLAQPEFERGETHTGFIEEHSEVLTATAIEHQDELALVAAAALASPRFDPRFAAPEPLASMGPWSS